MVAPVDVPPLASGRRPGGKVITSTKNAKIQAAARLKKRTYRERDRRFLAEGAQAVSEALASTSPPEVLFHTEPTHPVVERARAGGVEVVEVSADVMERLTSTVTPQGLVAVVPFLDVSLREIGRTNGCVALLHNVRDPGNAGTIVRSADASGADSVVFSRDSVDVYNPKTVRASAGSLFHLPVVRNERTTDAVGELRDHGYRILAMDADGEADLYGLDLSARVVFLFGNEAWGLPREVMQLADGTVRVPIQGRTESLNLAAAATVCLFEWSRQQREGRRVALETVISSAAHDIRSPLTAMKGFGYALSNRWDQMTPEQRSLMLQGIVYDTDRLNMILRQLVDAARVTAGRLELFPDRVDVGGLVQRIAEAKRVDPDHPEVVWGSGKIEVLTDPDRLQLVIEAFIEAVVWWATHGPVRVRSSLRAGSLRIEVERDTTELDADRADELFEPRPPGTGAGGKIGLFVARGIAEAQGGEVSVSVGRALAFRLDIPVPMEPQAG
ncbi:MAG TPA: TrmH family RNA methyltransferase [Actinomycetota bacterium]|nr:TrmH family RNA methyltransferase [Actinomycetota bacterium]